MKKLSEKILFSGKWLIFLETVFQDNKGRQHRWESIRRNSGAHTVVVVIARMVPSGRYVLIKQYRPAVDSCVIGFPAGICENGDIHSAALRELKEETGYTGRVVSISPQLRTSAATIDDTLYIAEAVIDEASTENTVPVQQLEPAEDIEVLLKHKEEIEPYIKEQQRKGADIGAGLWYLLL